LRKQQGSTQQEERLVTDLDHKLSTQVLILAFVPSKKNFLGCRCTKNKNMFM
jgi:hypothetical protein